MPPLENEEVSRHEGLWPVWHTDADQWF